MSKNLRLNVKNLRLKIKKFLPVLVKHISFIVMILVLVIYLFVVWKISQLAGAEPSANQDNSATAAIPKVDKNAIQQIQSLENSNTEVHSLFNSARQNPFSE